MGDERRRTRAAYDAVAESYAARLPGLDAETSLDVAMVEGFARRCAAVGGPVLDAGAGTGRISAHLRVLGLHVLGFDLSAGMVAVARRTHPNVPFAVAANERLPLARGAVAGAICWYSLIHTAPARLGAPLTELARVIRPGGWLLTAFQAGAGERVERTSAYGHHVPMTNYRHDPRQVVERLHDAGFDPHSQLHRAPDGRETTPQSVLLARRRGPRRAGAGVGSATQ